MPIEMNSFRGIARLDASLAEAKNHLASDLISASPLRSTLRSMRREGGGGDGCRFDPLPSPGLARIRLSSETIRIRFPAEPWRGKKATMPSFLGGGWGEGKPLSKPPIKCRPKLPTSRESWLNRLVYGKHSWNFDLTSLDCSREGKEGPLNLNFSPFRDPNFSPFDFNHSSYI